MTTALHIGAAWTALSVPAALWLGPRLARRGCPCGGAHS